MPADRHSLNSCGEQKKHFKFAWLCRVIGRSRQIHQGSPVTDTAKAPGRRPKTVPPPPDQLTRRIPLPSQQPKPHAEDPDAPARLRAILESPTYRQADQDTDFLARK